ncbi:MAG: hypothetical protein BKP49_08115 [Treponema sp. CETP13]|nr:MAG: hypothetical protein BKP49_08115 [Treponema sp. CETP13]
MSNVYHTYMCWKCGKETKINGFVSRSDVCPNCGADIRSCKNCVFYEPGAHYDCHETIDELVTDKERSNFCDYFKLNSIGDSKKNSNKSENSKDAFNKLFGD